MKRQQEITNSVPYMFQGRGQNVYVYFCISVILDPAIAPNKYIQWYISFVHGICAWRGFWK